MPFDSLLSGFVCFVLFHIKRQYIQIANRYVHSFWSAENIVSSESSSSYNIIPNHPKYNGTRSAFELIQIRHFYLFDTKFVGKKWERIDDNFIFFFNNFYFFLVIIFVFDNNSVQFFCSQQSLYRLFDREPRVRVYRMNGMSVRMERTIGAEFVYERD